MYTKIDKIILQSLNYTKHWHFGFIEKVTDNDVENIKVILIFAYF